MEKLSPINSLLISQKKEMVEIFTGFETKNKYRILDPSGAELYFAAETAGNTLLRLFLKAARPFTITVFDSSQAAVLRVTRPFRFYFHQAEVSDSAGNLLGSVKKRFSFLRRIYTVYGPTGEEAFQLFGPILHPWTFHIKNGDMEVGKITKKWSGLAKETFTDADNFAVTFPQEWDVKQKALMMGIVFLIDFVHFENTNN